MLMITQVILKIRVSQNAQMDILDTTKQRNALLFVQTELMDKIAAIYVSKFVQRGSLLMIFSIYVFQTVMQEEVNLLIIQRIDVYKIVLKFQAFMLKIHQDSV